MKKHTLMKQRFMGVAMIIVSGLIVLSGDATGALFTVPLGLALLLSRKAFIFED